MHTKKNGRIAPCLFLALLAASAAAAATTEPPGHGHGHGRTFADLVAPVPPREFDADRDLVCLRGRRLAGLPHVSPAGLTVADRLERPAAGLPAAADPRLNEIARAISATVGQQTRCDVDVAWGARSVRLERGFALQLEGESTWGANAPLSRGDVAFAAAPVTASLDGAVALFRLGPPPSLPPTPDEHWLLHPMPPRVFVQSYFERRPFVLTGRGAAHARVLGAEVASGGELVNRANALALRGEQLHATTPFRLVRRDPLDPDRFEEKRGEFPLAGADLAAVLGAGWSFVAHSVQNAFPRVASATFALSRVLGHFTNANLYVTPPGAARQALAAHWDDQEVLVLQMAGLKHWRVFEPQVLTPVRGDSRYAAPSGEPVVDVTLRPGDLLYVPAGFVHYAQATPQSVSVHVTFAVEVEADVRWAAAVPGADPLADQRLRRAVRPQPEAGEELLLQELLAAAGSGSRPDAAEVLGAIRRKAARRVEVARERTERLLRIPFDSNS